MKIVDKINKALEEDRPWWSFEYFPPKTQQGVQNLYQRIERMYHLQPTFVSVTWGAGGSTFERTVDLSSSIQSVHGLETCMHLTCTNMERETLDTALREAKDAGIQNILALRGDPPRGQEYWTPSDDQFVHAIDLVRYIRQNYGDYFCIGVAGYPEGHVDRVDSLQDLKYLKEKVDAGADFILTQLFYDVEAYGAWEKRCREIGITVPIIPVIMPIQNYSSFRRISNLCKIRIPEQVLSLFEPIKNDDEAVKNAGVQLAAEMVTELGEKYGVRGFHFSTLNLERSVREVLVKLGFVPQEESPQAGNKRVELASDKSKDELRPIFWKPKLDEVAGRGETWDEFPNGRWGDIRSPAFGEAEKYGISLPVSPSEALEMWSAPSTVQDISQLFTRYIDGTLQMLPWCDEPLQLESEIIKEKLLQINRGGLWTVGSQPAVNGARSDDPVFGWGPKGGYVYQKAFIEFFASPEQMRRILAKVEGNPFITYYASNFKDEFKTNIGEESPNAVTWGVFPGKEIVQPTIIEAVSFKTWKNEAFALWKEWARLYPPHSPSRRLLDEVADSWWLCNIVDNDYHHPDGIFEIFGLE
ncbi:uncharacterized protein VTP21DRAFT_2989 [Calcarisporiella thermophila]|uniref:uncharacterized protein n=1 Tax=Calcarisporiella thermophila TaxID=911321 RepID=UPI0037440131